MSWFANAMSAASLRKSKQAQQDTHNAAPGAAIIGAHSGRVTPDNALELDQRGTELPDTPNVFAMTRGRFRSAAQGVRSQADITFGSTQDQRVSAHDTRGARNLRQTDESERGNALGEVGHEDGPWTYNGAQRFVLPTPGETAPERPALGYTAADNTRQAWMIRPLFNRPFDKNMAEHPTTAKVQQPAPRAFHATQTEDLAQAFPSPGGWRGTKTAGLPQLRQAIRTVPGFWGADAVADDVVAVTPPVRGSFR